MNLYIREEKLQVLLQLIFECGIFRDKSKSPDGNGFRLALHKTNPDAPLSPFYLDFRRLRSFPRALWIAADLLSTAAEGFAWHRSRSFDLIADVPTAITPVVGVMAANGIFSMVTPRMDKKDHGTGANIDGEYSEGQKVVLVDDLITKANSKLEAIHVLEQAGLVVNQVLVIADREQGGATELVNQGYPLNSLFKITEMLDNFATRKFISEATCKEIMDYLGF